MNENQVRVINNALSTMAELNTVTPNQALDALALVNTVADELREVCGEEVFVHFHTLAARQFEIAKLRHSGK